MKKAIFLLLAWTLALGTPTLAARDKPNIVWLTTEDNSACWYRLYNEKGGAPMPHIEGLAKNGLVFDNAYSCGAVCSVARSTIISGLYAPGIGTQHHRKAIPVSMPAGQKLFPAYLRDAGYYTTNNYKQDYNFVTRDEKGVWDESSRKATFRNRPKGQPFFHVQNFHVTHEGQLFQSLPKGLEPVISPDDVTLFPYHPDTPLMRQKYAEYLTRQTLADAEIGKIIAQLEADGLLDDTFIFHYGDHGGVLPGSKGYAHNDGLQVAMVVYVPKNWQHLAPAKPGTRIQGMVEFVDLSATVLNLAGIEIPQHLDGSPFLGKDVTLDELNSRDTAFGHADRFDEKYDQVRFLRKGKFTYWRSYQPFNFDGLNNEYRYLQPAFREWRDLAKAGKLNTEQKAFYRARPAEMLFDLENDPHEVHNLADDPAHADTLATLRGDMQQRLKALPDLSFYPEPQFLRESKGNGSAFAKAHKEQISRLIDIADLQLLPFEDSREDLAKALNSPIPTERYWGLITCSAFDKEAAEFTAKAKSLGASDPDRLVRVRAAEFLGLTGAADPMPALIQALNETNDHIEACLILNTVVLLVESDLGWTFDPNKIRQASWMKIKKGEFRQHLKYLNDISS
ncbi:sulfatase-like hydrolase/transferase [Verrucomicrobiaceae bacterium 227]